MRSFERYAFLFALLMCVALHPCSAQTGEVRNDAVSVSDEPFRMAVRTNILTDLIAIPNVGADFSLPKRFTVGFDWQYAAWDDDEMFWWHTYGGDVNLKKWFGKRSMENAFAGHHVGIYANIYSFDFELNEKGGVLSAPYVYGGGVEYGYSAMLGKSLRLDFSVGIGGLFGIYKRYEATWNEFPEEYHYVWQNTQRISYFIPTKAEVSLVWNVGLGGSEKKGRTRR